MQEWFFLPDGIAARLRPVAEEDVPEWLWRHEPDEEALCGLPESGRSRGESCVADVIDRVAGGWTYSGWKGGYFDTERDARAFFDEIRWLLARGKCGPGAAQWRSAGLYWAYGLTCGDETGFVTDYRTGKVRRAQAGDLAPHGMFINGVHGALTGEGGGLDLWRREAEQIGLGARCGANVTDAVAQDVADFLTMGAAAVRYAPCGESGDVPSRRITIDSAHPECMDVARRNGAAIALAEFTETGRSLALRHIRSILDACRAISGPRGNDPERNPALRLALQSARQAMVPESAIRRTLDIALQCGEVRAEDVIAGTTDPDRNKRDDAGTVTVVRVADSAMCDENRTGPGQAPSVLDTVATAAWAAGNAGLDFASAIDRGNPCPSAGDIRSASGDGGYLFLDDTAVECAVIDAAAFRRDDASFDSDRFCHATALMTLALDISLMTRALPSPRIARRVWDFRPVMVSVTGVGDLLMANGIAYDSDAGRAYCAALCALVSGSASRISSELADELGPCPAWADNASDMHRVVAEQSDRVGGLQASIPADLSRSVAELWRSVPDAVRANGLRNAHVTAVCGAPQENAAIDCQTDGVLPVPSLVRWKATGTGGMQKFVAPAVPAALRLLGYSEASVDAIVRHIVGHGTLAHAPGVNHETLRRRGFTEAAIGTVENALADAGDLAQVFSRWVLGDTFCQRMLGFTIDELADEKFDMLAALGFSDAGIEAATVFCFGAGTMEGAPYLAPDHLPIFDCATPQGERGRRQVGPNALVRMMAAAQPFVSGGVGHAVAMPGTATIDDCREILRLGWHLGLKSLVIRGRDAEPSGPAYREDVATGPAAPTVVALVASSSRQTSGLADAAGHTSFETAIVTDTQTVGDDAEASRRASFAPAARSTASVPSSADAVVEQRQV